MKYQSSIQKKNFSLSEIPPQKIKVSTNSAKTGKKISQNIILIKYHLGKILNLIIHDVPSIFKILGEI